MTKLSKSQSKKVLKALAQHEKFKGCYFWKPNGSASNRRSQEKQNNWKISFKHDGVIYEYHSSLQASCANYYYGGEFFVNGEKKTVAAFKKLANKMDAN